MSAPKHTPGPWVKDDTFLAYVTDAEGYHIADCEGGRTPKQDDANARLIAAAPTMADYIAKKAAEGDAEAVQIMEAIHGNA